MPRSPISRPIVITERFGPNNPSYPTHAGIDIRSYLNDKWFACVPGFVHLKGTWPYLTGYGAHIELDWGQANGFIKFIYGHAKDRRKEYDNNHVAEGTWLGRSGNTGQSTAPHLHLEMRRYLPGVKGYTLMDPEKEFLQKYKIPYTYK